MNRTKQENERLKGKAELIAAEMTLKHPRPAFERCARSILEARAANRYPRFVYWLSEEKRNAAFDAEMRAFTDCVAVIDNSIDHVKLDEVLTEIKAQTKFLDRMVTTNDKRY